MAGNSLGTLFKLTTFGESHGKAIGGVIDGCPAGLTIDFEEVQAEMQRRKPGQSRITTQRKEQDEVVWLSGLFEGKTTGSPIGFMIENNDAKSKDYSHIKDKYRPSHADFTYDKKYGFRDYRGGGRSSARETACRVVAGAIARQLLQHEGVKIWAYVNQVGSVKCKKNYSELDAASVDDNLVRCPDEITAARMLEEIETVRKAGDTVGGVVSCIVEGCPIGLGEPVFDKLHADLGKSMLSINAVKGFEIGSGFTAATMKGSDHNDQFESNSTTQTNHSGGVQGGIANGMDIYFNVAFKPVATIMQDQQSIDKDGNEAVVEGKGRHDPCVVPRAVPIVEAMAAITIADHFLRNKVAKLS